MTFYGAKELAESFRTVRRNTVLTAEDIPEDQYGFRVSPETRSVAEMLAHVAVGTMWAHQVHGVERKTFLSFEDFATYMQRARETEGTLTTKAQILEVLRREGESYAAWLETLPDESVAESVGFPAPIEPPSKTRFEMLLSVKEHEMHHRAQLMLIERLLGIVPHLTRQRQERAAARATGAA